MATRPPAALLAPLIDDPAGLEGWESLAAWLDGRDAADLVLPPVLLPGLVDAWAQVPEDRRLVPAFETLTGSRVDWDPVRALPDFWIETGRARAPGPFDAITGLPLRIRRQPEGPAMVLVPGQEMIREDETRKIRIRVDTVYVNERPTPMVALIARGTDANPDDSMPVPAQNTFETAAGVLARLPARLITESEFELMVRGPDPSPTPMPRGLSRATVPNLRIPGTREWLETVVAGAKHPAARALDQLLRQGADARMIHAAAVPLFEDAFGTSPFGVRLTSLRDVWLADFFSECPLVGAPRSNPWFMVPDQTRVLDPQGRTFQQRIDDEMVDFGSRYDNAPVETIRHREEALRAAVPPGELQRIAYDEPGRRRLVRGLDPRTRRGQDESVRLGRYAPAFLLARSLHPDPRQPPVPGADLATSEARLPGGLASESLGSTEEAVREFMESRIRELRPWDPSAGRPR